MFLAAVAATAGVAALVLAAGPGGDDAIRGALRGSAHAAFLVLLLVFLARPLDQLLRRDWTRVLLRNRRLVGVALAGIHAAHLGLIVYRDRVSPEFDFAPAERIAGAVVYGFIFLMFVTSFDGPARAPGPNGLLLGLAALAVAIRLLAWQRGRRPAPA